MELCRVLTILILLVVVLKMVNKEGFCPYGYTKGDINAYQNYVSGFNEKYPVDDKSRCQGYDNPYIYPYNYQMNQNHPVDKYNFPGWVRELMSDGKKFNGYSY